MSVNKPYKRRFRFIGLRGKLLLASLTLLIFPLAGFSYLKELELFLKNNHAESVITIAQTIASVFRDNASLTALNALTQSPHKAIYSHPLLSTITIDGYSDDWFALQNVQQDFKQSPASSNNAMSLLCANDDNYYYFLLTVYQQKQVSTNSFGRVAGLPQKLSNVIIFQYLDYAHKIQEYRFNLDSPGWVNGYLNNSHNSTDKQYLRGEWQENIQGYSLEFRIPIGQINQRIAVHLQQQIGVNEVQVNTTSGLSIKSQIPLYQLNPLISVDPLSVLRLEQLVPKNTQLWLLNKQQFVNAKAKTAIPSDNSTRHDFSLLSLYRQLYLIVMNFPEQKAFYGSNPVQIKNTAISQTLLKKTSAEWLDEPHSNQLILSVATPVYDNEQNVIGTLLLEQSNDTLLALQDKTFERILLLTIILFFSVVVTLLFFSTRLLKRIINLRNDTELALAQDGKIENQLYRHDNDEIGDLARSFSTLLTRLDQHNQYLKTLASKLSHELRTPLTIIKSSLENMTSLPISEENHQPITQESHQLITQESPQLKTKESLQLKTKESPQLNTKESLQLLSEENHKYALRAQEGCQRLNDLLNRMSEASRLEQSINTMEKESIEVAKFLNNYIDTIQATHPDLKLVFNTSINKQIMNLSPELIAQLLDKLFNNAISYHTTGSTIQLELHREDNKIVIELKNYGRLIDENKLGSIFNSLTSYRLEKNQEVHLGLGLYIADLISKFHNGQLEAKNNRQEQTVSFILTLPI